MPWLVHVKISIIATLCKEASSLLLEVSATFRVSFQVLIIWNHLQTCWLVCLCELFYAGSGHCTKCTTGKYAAQGTYHSRVAIFRIFFAQKNPLLPPWLDDSAPFCSKLPLSCTTSDLVSHSLTDSHWHLPPWRLPLLSTVTVPLHWQPPLT